MPRTRFGELCLLCDTVLHMCDCAKVPVVYGVKENARASRLKIEFQPLHPIDVSEVRVRWSSHQHLEF